MRLEIRDKEEKKEEVAKLWLEYNHSGNIVLYAKPEGGMRHSVAYFDADEEVFHVFDEEVERLGYKVTSTEYPE